MDDFLRNKLPTEGDNSETDEVRTFIPGDQMNLQLEPLRHLRKAPDKGVRNIFVRALGDWMPDVPSDVLRQIAEIWQLVREINILLDDIQDNSPLRRGLPASHTIFGIANVATTADVLINEVYRKLLELKGGEAWKIGAQYKLIAFQGQGIELYWRTHAICPTEDEYLVMASKKNGASFVLISKLLQLFSKTDVNHLMALFGQYFQIRDDYQNLTSKEYFKTKGFGEDITEGKFGFPTVHACNSCPEVSDVLKGILKQHTNDMELKKKYIDILAKSGSLEYTQKRLDERKTVIQEEMVKLGKSKAVEDLVALIG